MRLIGIVLILCGILALGYGGFTYISNEKVAEVGPVEVRADRARTVWIPPVIGGAALVIGIVMVMSGRGRRAEPLV